MGRDIQSLFDGMAERVLGDVVEKSGRQGCGIVSDIGELSEGGEGGDGEKGVEVADSVGKDSQGVLEPCMNRGGKNVRGEAQLGYMTEPLKPGVVDQGGDPVGEDHVSA